MAKGRRQPLRRVADTLITGAMSVLRYVAIMLLAAVAGCGGSSGGKKYRIAVVPKGTSHQFWKSVHAGAQRAAQELGNVEVLWKGPQAEENTKLQIEVVKNFITKGVDGICLAPNQSKSLVDAVVEANEEKIPVVIFDSGLGDGADIVSYVATDNYHSGQLAADRLVEAMCEKEGAGKTDVILLRYMEGSESTEQRERGFLDRLKQKHPQVNVLSSNQYGGSKTITALTEAKTLLHRYHDQVDGVFAVCEPNANGMLEALEQSGLAGKVKFVAFDPSDSLIAGMKSQPPKVHGILLQDPVEMGYQAVKAMVAKLEGQPPKARIPTGEYVATPDNMNTATMDRLLHPKVFEE
jgi:ribose transport system substrate-binding protein